MDTLDDLEKLWLEDVVRVLTQEQPRLRSSALHVIFLLETHKISHPYWKQLYKGFEKGWTRMQNSMDAMMINIDANRHFIQEEVTFPKEDFESKLLVQERQVLKSSVFSVWNVVKKYNRQWKAADWMNGEHQTFMHGWVVMEGYLDSMIDPKIPREEDMRFCCELKCFLLPNECVDGPACGKCRSSGYCKCDCVKHMKYMHDTHCCPLFCTRPKLGICLLCPGACLCKCVAHQREILKKVGIETIRVNGQVMELVKHREGLYCCDNKCFVIPLRLIRGLACKRCDGVNFCKCNCVGRTTGYVSF